MSEITFVPFYIFIHRVMSSTLRAGRWIFTRCLDRHVYLSSSSKELQTLAQPIPPTKHSPPVTGPVARFARQIASQGYIVAAPSSYHEFVGPEALAYDVPGTDLGNDLKTKKKVSAYDEDATLTVDHLLSMSTCTGRIGATGMCLGGHLAYRAALDKRVNATVCYFATDIHSKSLGEGMNDDSLARTGEIKGEVVMVSV